VKIITIFAIMLFILTAGNASASKRSATNDYPGPWLDEFNLPLVQLIAKKNIRVCGEMYFKRYKGKSDSDFLVKCSREGKKFYYFLAFPRIDELQGPYNTPEYDK